MWTYIQSTGRLLDPTGRLAALGYSGGGIGKNNPLQQAIHDVGPIPAGTYQIEAPVDTHTHGPYVLWLSPDEANQMWGRSAFGIHGDSMTRPGSASEGCVILPRTARQAIWDSGDHRLQVRADEPVVA